MLIDSETLKRAILTTMPERSEVLLIVGNQPEAVVRCKDCQLGGECDEWMGHKAYSCKGGETHDENWFCADGKRKDGDGE